MTEPKRKVGRPRKAVEEVNPDTETATKGYVKCLLRKTRDHTHEQKYDYGWCALTAACALLYVVVSWCLTYTTRGVFVLGHEHAFAFTIGIVCLMVALDQSDIGCMNTDGVTQKEPKEINAYCEKKRDCE